MRRPSALSACLVLAIVTLAGAAAATPATNGRYVNGQVMNGRYVNGRYVNGRYVNTALPNGGTIGTGSVGTMTRFGMPVSSVHVEGSEIVGLTPTPQSNVSTEQRGTWFVGAELSATLEDPSTGEIDAVRLRIAGASTAAGGTFASGIARRDYWHYVMNVGLPDGAGGTSWEPLCGISPETNSPVAAIALRGSWNYSEGTADGGAKASDNANHLTFACENGALGKCAGIMKYAPWESNWVETCTSSGCTWVYRDLVDVHQACSRMVRADYCGDGVTHTENGTPIDIFDDLYSHNNTPSPNPWAPFGQEWQFEGAWGPNGVVNASCGRLRDNVAVCPTYIALVTGPHGIPHPVPVHREHTFACYSDPLGALSGNGSTIGNMRQSTRSLPRGLHPLHR